MKTNVVVMLCACVLVFAACKKEHSNDTTNTSTADYQPTSAGSTWSYTSTSQGAYTETATGTDTTISGQKFYAFDNSASGRRYVNKNNGIYTSFGRVPQLDTTLTLKYLIDAPAGTNWTNQSVYSGIPVTLTSTIASRDGEMTVNGTNFKDVISVDFTITALNPITNQTISIADGKQFYAKGVGTITSTLHLSAQTVNIDDSTYLTSYQIK